MEGREFPGLFQVKQQYIGVEIGGTKVQVVAGGADGMIRQRRRFAVDRAKGATGIQRQIEQGLLELLADQKAKGVGVGFGGPVDWKSGRVCCSHHIEGWTGFDLREWLQKLTRSRVIVDNDGNVAALGEATRGAGVGSNPIFYVTLGSGVGGGLVVDGRIYHGAMPGEAEIGHVRLDQDGTTLESRCSGWAVDAKIRTLKTKDASSLLGRLADDGETAEARHLSAALEHRDSAAVMIVTEVARDLAFGLSHVVHLVHPQMIVLGGGLSKIGEPLRMRVKDALTQFIMQAFRPGPEVSISTLGEDAVPVGALVLAATDTGIPNFEDRAPKEIGISKPGNWTRSPAGTSIEQK
jgi:glucokinase